jgi:hypothetical protein
MYQRMVYMNLHRFHQFGLPVLVALPRKVDPAATEELIQMIVDNGADFVRAHQPLLAVAAASRRSLSRLDAVRQAGDA